jgi:hypothetical protein
MPNSELDKPKHTRTLYRALGGALIGGVIGLVAGSVGLSVAEGSAWVLPIDMIVGALAGLFMALVSAW